MQYAVLDGVWALALDTQKIIPSEIEQMVTGLPPIGQEQITFGNSFPSLPAPSLGIISLADVRCYKGAYDGTPFSMSSTGYVIPRKFKVLAMRDPFGARVDLRTTRDVFNRDATESKVVDFKVRGTNILYWEDQSLIGNGNDKRIGARGLSHFEIENFDGLAPGAISPGSIPSISATGSSWRYERSNGNGRLRTDIVSRSGRALLLDSRTNGERARNSVIWTLDLSALAAASTDYYLRGFIYNSADEPDAADGISIRGSALSSNWTRIHDGQTSSPQVWEEFDLPISAALRQAGQDFSSTTEISFSQEDDFTYTADGIGFDDIEIYSRGGAGSSAGSPWAQQFARLVRHGVSPFAVRVDYELIPSAIEFESDNVLRRDVHDNDYMRASVSADVNATAKFDAFLAEVCHHPLPARYRTTQHVKSNLTVGFRQLDCLLDPAVKDDPFYNCLSSAGDTEVYFDPSCCCNETKWSCIGTGSAIAVNQSTLPPEMKNRAVCGSKNRRETPSQVNCDVEKAALQFCGTQSGVNCTDFYNALVVCENGTKFVCGERQCSDPEKTVISMVDLDIEPQVVNAILDQSDYACVARFVSISTLMRIRVTLEAVQHLSGAAGSRDAGNVVFAPLHNSAQKVVGGDSPDDISGSSNTVELVDTGVSGRGASLAKLSYNFGLPHVPAVAVVEATGGQIEAKSFDTLRLDLSTRAWSQYTFGSRPVNENLKSLADDLTRSLDFEALALIRNLPSTGPFEMPLNSSTKEAREMRTGFVGKGFSSRNDCADVRGTYEPYEILPANCSLLENENLAACQTPVRFTGQANHKWQAPLRGNVLLELESFATPAVSESDGLGTTTESPEKSRPVLGAFPAAEIDMAKAEIVREVVVDTLQDTATLVVEIIGNLVGDDPGDCIGFFRVEVRDSTDRSLLNVIDFVGGSPTQCPQPINVTYSNVIATAEEYLRATGRWQQPQARANSSNSGNSSTSSNDTRSDADGEGEDVSGNFLQVSITLVDKRARATFIPRDKGTRFVYEIEKTDKLENTFELSDENRTTLFLSGGFLVLVLLVWVFLCCCAAHVRKRGPYERARDLNWCPNPIKKLSFHLQDCLPASSSSSEFQSSRHSAVVIALCVTGIARIILFSFTFFLLIFLWATADARNTLAQFPETWNDVNKEIAARNDAILAYKDQELNRQRALADNITLACLGEIRLLEIAAYDEQIRVVELNEETLDSCQLSSLRDLWYKMKKQKANAALEDFKKDLADYKNKVNNALDKAQVWVGYAKELQGACATVKSIVKDVGCGWCDCFLDACADEDFFPDSMLPAKMADGCQTDPGPEPPQDIDGPSVPPSDNEELPANTYEEEETEPTDGFVSQFATEYEPVTPDVDIPSVTFSFSAPDSDLSFLLGLGIVLIADILLMMRRVIKLMSSVSEAVNGEIVYEEISGRVFNANHEPISIDADKENAVKKALKGVGGACFACASWIQTRIAWFARKWPLLMYACQMIVYLAIVLGVIGCMLFVVWLLLQPGVLEEIGWVQALTLGIEISVATTNGDIVMSAFRINTGELSNLNTQAATRLQSIQEENEDFNKKQASTFLAFNVEYETTHYDVYREWSTQLEFGCGPSACSTGCGHGAAALSLYYVKSQIRIPIIEFYAPDRFFTYVENATLSQDDQYYDHWRQALAFWTSTTDQTECLNIGQLTLYLEWALTVPRQCVELPRGRVYSYSAGGWATPFVGTHYFQPPTNPSTLAEEMKANPRVTPQFAALPTLGNLDFEDIQCQIEPGVDARLYTEFNTTAFQIELNETFQVHIDALRDLIETTLLVLLGFLVFFILIKILGALTWALLKLLGAVRVNRRGWTRILPVAGHKVKKSHLDRRDWEILSAMPEEMTGSLKDRVATVAAMARLVRIDVAKYLDHSDSDSDNEKHDGDSDDGDDDIPLRVVGKKGDSWRGKHTHKQPSDARKAKIDPEDHTACDFVMATDKPLPKAIVKSLRNLASEAERFAEWVTETMSVFGPKAEIFEIEAASRRKRPRTWQEKAQKVDLTATGQGTRDKVLRVLLAARALQSSSPDTVIFDVNKVREAAMNVADAANHHRGKLAMKMQSSRMFRELNE